MTQSVFIFSLLLTQLISIAQGTVRIELRSLPAYHPSNSEVYIAGSFNGWNPQDRNFRFQRGQDGKYFIDIQLKDGQYEYKITRGAWEKAECKKGGGTSPNRTLVIPGSAHIELDIDEWADRFGEQARKSTANARVHVIDTAFLIPELQRARRIWIYLPAGYAAGEDRYPVLYMHDGQNLFDDATSYAGEWGVDECVDSMKNKCIIVGIDNGGLKRMNEYCPYDMPRYGKGQGDAYVDFLVRELKPFIDQHYRTLADKSNTFIAGSSMGGLISLYAVLKYPGTFGGAGIFSPAFWIAPRLLDDLRAHASQIDSKLYFYAGDSEGGPMVQDMENVYGLMKSSSHSVLTELVRPGGQHNESRWRQEFPLFYDWLLGR